MNDTDASPRFTDSVSTKDSNAKNYDFSASWEQDKEPSSWKVIAAIATAVALLAAGIFIVNARAKEKAYDPQANVQEIAEVVNEAHRAGCRLFISVGASSDETDTTLTKNAQKEADGVRGAEVAAYDVGPASSKDMVTDAAGGQKRATFIATVAALECPS